MKWSHKRTIIFFVIIYMCLAVKPVKYVTEYKQVKTTEYVYITKYIEKEQKNIICVKSQERELIARLLWTEARGENDECQRAIVSVIFNRLKSGNWGNTIHNVIYANGQFDCSSILFEITPTEKEYKNVDYILKNGKTLPDWVQYFRADHHFKWDKFTEYSEIDNTYFGGFYYV